MPTATPARNLGKTGFVKEYLNDHPQANTRAVNEAWSAAGFEGTIGPTLVTRMRSEMGLTGNIRKGPGKKSEVEAGAGATAAGKERGGTREAIGDGSGRRPKQATAGSSGTTALLGRGGNQGKTPFVVEHLQQDPDATDDEIAEAWAAAGNEGGISGSLIYKIRAKEGLTGRRGTKGRGAGTKGGARSSKEARSASAPGPAAGTFKPFAKRTGRGRVVAELEGDLDRLIFKLIALGGMEEIEDELRKVRRRLILSQRL